MLDTKNNALAELAKNIKHSIVCLKRSHYKGDGLLDIDKIQRIVAELAKVSEGAWVEDCGGKFYLSDFESRVVETAIGKCRAIA